MNNLLLIDMQPPMTWSEFYTLRLECLSKEFSGDIIAPVFEKDRAIQKVGNFSFQYLRFIHGNAIFRTIVTSIKIFFVTFRLCRIEKRRYKAIISSNPLVPGLVALLLGKIFNIKTIIEVNGDFKEAFKYGQRGVIGLKRREKIKEFIVIKTIAFCLSRCDMVKTLYKDQLLPFHFPPHAIKSMRAFSDFVPLSKFAQFPRTDKKFLLLLGFPWYLKGVDVLIKAFKAISDDFPEYSLKIYGYNPKDRDYFEKLAEGNNKIHLGKPLRNNEVIEAMSACSIYVLASRTEAMGRVLIEAMACQKPIIASRVGGVHSIIKDGFNGLLFEKENVIELSEKLRLLLTDQELSDRLALNGYNFAKDNLSENCFIHSYKTMIGSL